MKVYDQVVDLVYKDQFVQAEALIPLISDCKIRSSALQKISIGYSFAKKWEPAKRVAFSIPSNINQSVAISYISYHLFRDGKLEESKELSLWDPDVRNYSSDQLFRVCDLLEKNKVQEAKSLAIWVPDLFYRGLTITQIFYHLFRQEKIDEAFGMAALHPKQKIRNYYVTKISKYYLRKMDVGKAKKILFFFSDFRLERSNFGWTYNFFHVVFHERKSIKSIKEAHDVVITAIKMNKSIKCQEQDLKEYFCSLKECLVDCARTWEIERIKNALSVISDDKIRCKIMESIGWDLYWNKQRKKCSEILVWYKEEYTLKHHSDTLLDKFLSIKNNKEEKRTSIALNTQ